MLVVTVRSLTCAGSETYPNITFNWVHVKDVANAHIQALEMPSANGRYCLAETVAHFAEVVKILKELYPDAKLPEKYVLSFYNYLI